MIKLIYFAEMLGLIPLHFINVASNTDPALTLQFVLSWNNLRISEFLDVADRTGDKQSSNNKNDKIQQNEIYK